MAVLCLFLAIILHGCGGYDPVTVAELRIADVELDQQNGVRVRWRTTDPATSRIDYGPEESAVRTFYQPDKNGIGLDPDGHVMAERRTDATTVPPVVNTVLDERLVLQHSLVATETSTGTPTYFAITSQSRDGQIATVTVSIPRNNPVVGGVPP